MVQKNVSSTPIAASSCDAGARGLVAREEAPTGRRGSRLRRRSRSRRARSLRRARARRRRARSSAPRSDAADRRGPLRARRLDRAEVLRDHGRGRGQREKAVGEPAGAPRARRASSRRAGSRARRAHGRGPDRRSRRRRSRRTRRGAASRSAREHRAAAREVRSAPVARKSSSRQPTPSPSEKRPPEIASSVAACFASSTRLARGRDRARSSRGRSAGWRRRTRRARRAPRASRRRCARSCPGSRSRAPRHAAPSARGPCPASPGSQFGRPTASFIEAAPFGFGDEATPVRVGDDPAARGRRESAYRAPAPAGSRGARRTRGACVARSSTSQSRSVARSGSAICTGWWMRSPVITASSPRERMRTPRDPACARASARARRSAETRWSVSTRSARPAAKIGRTESPSTSSPRLGRRRGRVLPLVARDQIARAREGGHARRRRRAACSSRRGRGAGAYTAPVDRVRREARGRRAARGTASDSPLQTGLRRCLSLPTQVSTTQRRSPSSSDERVHREAQAAVVGRRSAARARATSSGQLRLAEERARGDRRPRSRRRARSARRRPATPPASRSVLLHRSI